MNKKYLIILLYTSFLSASSSSIYKIIYYNSLIPENTQLRQRVLTTICCRDCDYLPKVTNAGKVIFDEDENSYQLMHNGLKVFKDCYYGSWMTTLIELLQGHHEPQEEKAFHEVLKYIPNNAVMVELGSYWAYYSMWFQQKIQGAKNFLIEPDPKNIIIGQKHFSLNNMEGYFTQAMVGAKSEEFGTFTDWEYNKHSIKAICLDDFAKENQIDFIHILHSDIQGAEINMLKGCKQLIQEKHIGYFFISTHRGTHKECLKILEESNLEIVLSISRKESFSADGLIIAKLPEIPGPKDLHISVRSSQFCNIVKEITNENK